MIEKIIDMICDNGDRFNLLNNGYEIEGCERGYLYFDTESKEFIELGYGKGYEPIVINIKKTIETA